MVCCCVAGVSNSVAGQLSAAGLNHVQQLLPAIRHLAAVLECATPAGSPEASSILSQLGQVHLCIVEVDDALDRQQLATGERCARLQDPPA